MYAQDNDGVVLLDGYPQGSNTWAVPLRSYLGLPTQAAATPDARAASAQQAQAPATDSPGLDMFVCPIYKPFHFQNWVTTYGVRRDAPVEFTRLDPLTFDVYLRIDAIPNPTEYLHVTDTTSRGRGGYGAQQYYLFEVGQQFHVHARHNQQASGLFLDGHVEGASRTRLDSLGIDALFDVDTAQGYF
jgi:prepilin-type processing-associated H-X9-DG protein